MRYESRSVAESARLSVWAALTIVVVLALLANYLGLALPAATRSGECGRAFSDVYVSDADVRYYTDLQLPAGSRIVSACLIDHWFRDSTDIQVDAEVHVPRSIDSTLLDQHYAKVHEPTDLWDLPTNRPHWAAALHRLHDIRFFTNKLRMGENAGTFVMVGVEPDGRLTLVADLLGGTDNL